MWYFLFFLLIVRLLKDSRSIIMLSHNNSGGPHISFATGVISLPEIYICIVNQCKYCNFCYGKIKLLNLVRWAFI